MKNNLTLSYAMLFCFLFLDYQYFDFLINVYFSFIDIVYIDV